MSFKLLAALAINHVGVTVPDIYAATDWGMKRSSATAASWVRACSRPTNTQRRYSAAAFAKPGLRTYSAKFGWYRAIPVRRPADPWATVGARAGVVARPRAVASMHHPPECSAHG